MHAYRAALLRFDSNDQCLFDEDGLLVVSAGCVLDAGDYTTVHTRHPAVPITHWPQRIIAPGFIDLHVHYPQVDVIAAPAQGLLPWLEAHTFPAEKRFSDPVFACGTADFFLEQLLANGVSTALCFATSHSQSVTSFFQAAQARGLRMMSGKVLQDRNSPEGLRDETEQSLLDSEALLQAWHGVDRLGYAITPRFVPTSSPEQLRGAGVLAARYPEVWIQSHLAENRDEVAWVKTLFPKARSYLDVYHGYGLLRDRAVYAHCIWLGNTDRALMRDSHSAVAVCPTSNLFLGSGFFDYSQATGMRLGLGSDVGGGTSLNPFHTMQAAYFVGREGLSKTGLSLKASDLWYQHTAGAAKALGLDGVIGSLQTGAEADFIVLNPHATPLLARRSAQASNLEELLFVLQILGDDRAIEQVHIANVGMSKTAAPTVKSIATPGIKSGFSTPPLLESAPLVNLP